MPEIPYPQPPRNEPLNPLAMLQQFQNLRSSLRQFDISNDSAVRDLLGSLATHPGLSKDVVRQYALAHSRNNPHIPADTYTNLINGLPDDPRGLQTALSQFAKTQAGAASMIEPTAGPPALTGPMAGEETRIPKGAAINVVQGQPAGVPSGSTQPASGAGVPGGGSPLMRPTDPWYTPPLQHTPGGFGLPRDADFQTKLYNAGKATSVNYTNDTEPMKNALRKIATLGPDTLGPGSQIRNTFQSAVTSLFGDENIQKVPVLRDWFDPKKEANYSETEKYLIQSSRQQGMGGATDLDRLITQSANPNVTQPQAAAERLMKVTLAMRRAEELMHKTGEVGGPLQYGTVREKMPNNIDVRALMVDQLSPKDRRDLFDHVQKEGGQAWARFTRTLRQAEATNVMPRP